MPKDKPAPVQFAEGWTIGKPDIIVEFPKEIQLPATGVIDQSNLVVKAHFERDMWVKAAEVKPGNARVVHHMKAIIRPPNSTWLANVPGRGVVRAAARRGWRQDGPAAVRERSASGAGHSGEVQPGRRRAELHGRQRCEIHRRRLGHRVRDSLHDDRQARESTDRWSASCWRTARRRFAISP